MQNRNKRKQNDKNCSGSCPYSLPKWLWPENNSPPYAPQFFCYVSGLRLEIVPKRITRFCNGVFGVCTSLCGQGGQFVLFTY